MTDTTAPKSDAPSSPPSASAESSPEQASPAAPAPSAEPELTAAYRAHLDALIAGTKAPAPGTEDLVEDLKVCARKQDEARAALQQASQFVQAKQAEAASLQGEGTALVRVLKRIEDRDAQKT